MKFIKKNWHKLILLSYLFLIPMIVLAQNTVSGEPCDAVTPGKISNPIKACTINEFIKTFLEGALKIGIPIIALAVIYSGFLFVQARGNSEKLTKAKDALFYTLVGAAILLGSWAIAMLISETVLAL